ncbi:MAG: aldolase/citrate lyase family protein [Fusobacterium perfoetens]|uniref:HpcH/HpaI aldolase family protein n=1 Tax=Fusobacterium perfoetens TaxID=852 RepID=UPI0023F30629|nr:aldolase/citrate lyase family protein [Fusobacterium perfoetens]MCI6151626.1 aldolase/citrate lyase family protein [Fusobacterium perfoetens]MDY3237794.1 aldolase/citrate lyase family protein [Fusobacterium perfoetens]
MLKQNEVFKNIAKEKLKNNKKVSAAWLQTGSNITAEILAKAEFDVLAIDMEHGPGNIMTLIQQLQAISKYEITPIVRVPWNDSVQIKKILDTGVHGVIIPYIGNKEEAEKAVKSCKYPLEGIRGIAPSPRAGGFGLNSANYLKRANDEILIFVQIESKEGVENIEEICSVKGIDGIFVGPMDLATSMGYFCNPQAEEVKEAVKKIEKVALENNKFLGTVAGDFEGAKKLYDKNYGMVIMMSDSTSLEKLAVETANKFKEKYNI